MLVCMILLKHNSLSYASFNSERNDFDQQTACKAPVCSSNYTTLTIFHTHTYIHSISNRSLPDQMLNYKHAISMYKLFNHCQPETEFIQMNFQYNQNQRINHANFFLRQNYESGKNILLNRLSHLNDKIEKSWLEQSLNTFKVKCKELFLKN